MEKNDGNGSAEEGAHALAETQDSKKAGTVCDEIMPTDLAIKSATHACT
jgi:hypothetical protein